MTIFEAIQEVNVRRILGVNVAAIEQHLLRGETDFLPRHDEHELSDIAEFGIELPAAPPPP